VFSSLVADNRQGNQPVNQRDNQLVNQRDDRRVSQLADNRDKSGKSHAADSRLAGNRDWATTSEIACEIIAPLLHRCKFKFTPETQPLSAAPAQLVAEADRA
jgi:hypothetical protein